MRVAVLTCRRLPRFVTWEIPDVDALFTDDRMLIAAFQEHGVEAEPVVWSDPSADWNAYDVALIRSTWDYIDERESFLAAWGIPIVPTVRALTPLDKVPSHALLKKPAAGDFRSQGIYGGTIQPDLLYARLDLVRIDGRLAIM